MKKVFLALAVIGALASCDKNDSIIDDNQLMDVDLKSTVESVVTTEAQLDDVAEAADYEVDLFTSFEATMEAVSVEQTGSSLKSGDTQIQNRIRERYKLGRCPNIQIINENGEWPRTITLDYGDGTELNNGRVISGIIEIVMTGPRYVNGNTRTVTFINFSVDTIGIAGTIVKTFLIDELKVNIVRDLTFTLPDGTTIDRDAERSRVWVKGINTPFDHSDDVFEITGFVNCEDSDGNVYRREITNRLIRKGGCRFIVAGEVTLSKNGVHFATINYGNGECDNLAMMHTANGKKQFEIGKRIRERRQEGIQQ